VLTAVMESIRFRSFIGFLKSSSNQTDRNICDRSFHTGLLWKTMVGIVQLVEKTGDIKKITVWKGTRDYFHT
jgi:ferric iron reductase protein FhuF